MRNDLFWFCDGWLLVACFICAIPNRAGAFESRWSNAAESAQHVWAVSSKMMSCMQEASGAAGESAWTGKRHSPAGSAERAPPVVGPPIGNAQSFVHGARCGLQSLASSINRDSNRSHLVCEYWQRPNQCNICIQVLLILCRPLLK